MPGLMRNCYYAQYADVFEPPTAEQLKAWTVWKWVKRYSAYHKMAQMDLRFTNGLEPGKDEIIEALLRAEWASQERLEHLTGEALPVDESFIPNDYEPQKVTYNWIDRRMSWIIERRVNFATMYYWKMGAENQGQLDKQMGNSIVGIMDKHIRELKKYGAADWQGPKKALQEYVQSLEEMRLILATGSIARPVSYTNHTALMLRTKLSGLTKRIIDLNEADELAIRIRPWRVDIGIYGFTQEEFDRIDAADAWLGKRIDVGLPQMGGDPADEFVLYGGADRKGVPMLLDGPIWDRAASTPLALLAEERRQDIDKMLTVNRSGRYSRLVGVLKAERKIWGECKKSIGRLRGHGLWEEDREAE